ncbi:hypothetical protein LZ32DRAFT_241900 [Colletotrichum eremochloae]|nr:hypothetical protein LZ32DRAFT_241900 [Colletotrichum eremochloae]
MRPQALLVLCSVLRLSSRSQYHTPCPVQVSGGGAPATYLVLHMSQTTQCSVLQRRSLGKLEKGPTSMYNSLSLARLRLFCFFFFFFFFWMHTGTSPRPPYPLFDSCTLSPTPPSPSLSHPFPSPFLSFPFPPRGDSCVPAA